MPPSVAFAVPSPVPAATSSSMANHRQQPLPAQYPQDLERPPTRHGSRSGSSSGGSGQQQQTLEKQHRKSSDTDSSNCIYSISKL